VALALAIAGAVVASWPLNILDVRARAPFASVASAFGPAPGYPGYQWSRDGRDATNEVTTISGPAHCGWQSATMLLIGWPLGTRATTSSQTRMYIRDPDGVYGVEFRDRLVLHAALPPDARRSGYRVGQIEIYLAPSDQDDAIYVVAPPGAERWPRVDPQRLCA
jgi:hypothetical protein